MKDNEKRAIGKLRKACTELRKLGLGLFGWSGKLNVIRMEPVQVGRVCPFGLIGNEIIDDDFQVHADGGDPQSWEDPSTGINYLVS